MHFEVVVEDRSGKKALDLLIPKIVGEGHTFEVHAYKGIGRIPRNMKEPRDASRRILLENLPKLLKGYGKTFAGYGPDYPAALFVICDLDDKCLASFRRELLGILDSCNPKPETRFCIAIEEGEAWFLGDLGALRTAYPRAKEEVLRKYVPDSICNTWELLADAVYPGGASALSVKGWQAVGKEKSRWAENIAPHMDVSQNRSPSFVYFRDKLAAMIQETV